MARYSTLFLALVIASPALHAGFVTHQLDPQTALLRLLIAVPVAAVMLGLFRLIVHGYGKPDPPERPAVPGEAPDGTSGEPLRAEAVAGEPFAQRRMEDTVP